DRNAKHTLFADEAVYIGPAASRESYLKMDTIISAAKSTGADAIHPGYGFLSENAAFVTAVTQNDIIFIGPPAASMIQMGSKIEAKQTARKKNVPLVPGTDKAIESIEEATEIAKQTGFPLLIKASAGGGGKGMRLVQHANELEEQLKSASNEAMSAFGNGAVFIEKFISKPRHIEIQVLTDTHGNGVYLFERECSIQRRHQKIIEEAPSSCLTPFIRKQMGIDAVNLALSCGYVGAGTVEFLVDENMNYYFLEMNTRLQVEHTVTEMITGLDLVQLQIQIAEGNALPFNQEDLKINGHSIELRICAEDPTNHFLPSIGILTKYKTPKANYIRVDDCYEEGMEIPIHYDPMIGKLISFGKNRLEAIENLKFGIQHFEIEGVETTLDFGHFVLEHPDFIQGQFDTGFIEKYYSQYLDTFNDQEESEAIGYIALFAYLQKNRQLITPKLEDSSWFQNRKTFN
ncbi:MAG: biotin carboxylase N-terminal domain-containing protein, partial [Saprospiraceae bacterium]